VSEGINDEREYTIDRPCDTEGEVDVVTRPKHYTQFEIEPVTFVMKNDLPFWLGNVIKYGCRAGSKQYDGMSMKESEAQDIKKLIRYAGMRLNQLSGRGIL
tara:strand:+ start:363 stop:665 length:303 start_codon:yes stop_codon:yes gene_type:complete